MKKIFFVSVSLLLVLESFSPFVPYTFAQSVSTPSATERMISLINPSSTDSAVDQTTPTPSFSETSIGSANLTITPPVFVMALSKENFQAKEQVEVVVKNASDKSVSLTVQDKGEASYTPTTTQTNVNGDTVFTVYPSANLRPGRYKIKVVDVVSSTILSEQEFTWGVLAINTNKSIYLPGETANIAMAVLDETGNMNCNANVTLDIVAPYGFTTHLSTDDGSIKVNPDCRIHAYTLNPDYEALYQTSDIGRYTMTLTATTPNGSYTTQDRFEVRSDVAFDIERVSATRVYPPDKYPVKLKITANQAFSGKIVESVPSDFEISQLQQDGVIGYAEESSVPDKLGVQKDYGIPKLHLPFNGDYPVTLGFGQQLYDSNEINVYKKSGLDGHDGIDFGLPWGTPVLAADSGKVILAEENWIYGTSIVIQHVWGRIYYGHLSKLEVSVGDEVSAGAEIGLSGSTGLATGPHLHFGLKPNDYDINNLYFGKIDPAPYLGISSEDPVLSVSDYPISTKALVWNVEIAKGAQFVIGYQFKAPNKSPDFYTIGPLQFISSQINPEPAAKFDVNINPFVLSAATSSGVLIATTSASLTSTTSADLTATSSADLTSQPEVTGQNNQDQVIFQEIRSWQLAIDTATTVIITTSYTDSCGSNCWTVPSNWDTSGNNSIEVVGPGGNGTAATTSSSGGGGGGGAYSKVTNQIYTPGTSKSFQIGTGGSGNASWFDTSGTVNAGAGTNASTTTHGSGGTVGAGSGYSGGNGGNGSATAATPGAGGGGAGGLNGTGGGGGSSSGSSTNNGGSGGGANGGGGAGSAATSATGGAGGDIYGGGGHGGAGGTGAHTAGDGGSGTIGGGGGGGGGTNATGVAGWGGTGSRGTDLAAGYFGTGGGGGGGGGDSKTNGGSKTGGTGGSSPANTGAGGGGGGACSQNPGGLGNGSNGFIIVTNYPTVPTLDEMMKHGMWFTGGVKQTFTFLEW